MLDTHGIMYHHFHDDKLHIKGQGSISSEDFDRMLTFYEREKNYNFISANNYTEKSLKGSLKNNDICITFDDALKCQFDIAYPILKKRNISAFWFVYTSPLEGVIERLELYRHFRFSKFSDIDEFYAEFFRMTFNMEKDMNIDIKSLLKEFNPENFLKGFPFYSYNDKKFRYLRDDVLGIEKYNFIMDEMLNEWDYDVKSNSKLLWMEPSDIKELYSQGHVIGLHSHTHPTAMEKLSYSEQMKEYSTNKEILESITKSKVNSVSYPCNSYNNNTISIMKELDIKIGFRANLERGFNSVHEMRREDHSNILKEMNYENYNIHK